MEKTIARIKTWSWNNQEVFSGIRWFLKLVLTVIVVATILCVFCSKHGALYDGISIIAVSLGMCYLLSDAFTDHWYWLPKCGDVLYDNSKDNANRDYDKLVNYYGFKEKQYAYVVLGIDKKRYKILYSFSNSKDETVIRESDIHMFFRFHDFILIGKDETVKNNSSNYYKAYKAEQLDKNNPYKS